MVELLLGELAIWKAVVRVIAIGRAVVRVIAAGRAALRGVSRPESCC